MTPYRSNRAMMLAVLAHAAFDLSNDRLAGAPVASLRTEDERNAELQKAARFESEQESIRISRANAKRERKAKRLGGKND